MASGGPRQPVCSVQPLPHRLDTVHPVALGFRGAADAYERARPEYPAAAIDWLVARLGLRSSDRVLDIGAGTGRLSAALAAHGAHVTAVEPLDEMRAALEARHPDVDARAGTAEHVPLADGEVRAVVAGQAFHWFAHAAALAEFARVLSADGRLGLVWNRRNLDQPVQTAIEELIAAYRRDSPSHASGQWNAAFADHGAPFALEAEQTFGFEQQLDREGVVDRVVSISFIAKLAGSERLALGERVRERFPDGASLSYTCEAFVYRRAQ